MPTPRREQIQLESTAYYHCMTRCVRRAFLCGFDKFTGRSFDHRKPWLVEKIKLLADVFAIDVCAYAIMANHVHLVVRIDQKRALAWEKDEVIARWRQVFKGHPIIERYLSKAPLSAEDHAFIDNLIMEWRTRLYDISWFMRILNESIARQANREDEVTGRFWEGRFKSQALLDDTALLACMLYVDLNPIRAGICNSLEESDFTSIQLRLREEATKRTQNTKGTAATENDASIPEVPLLFPFQENPIEETQNTLPFTQADYFELIDWTGRTVRLEKSKKGHIPEKAPSILDKLKLTPQEIFDAATQFELRFKRAAGTMEKLKQFAHAVGRRWLQGMKAANLQINEPNLFR